MNSPICPPPFPKPKTISGERRAVKDFRKKVESMHDHGLEEADELIDTIRIKIAELDAEVESEDIAADDSD